jgi:hypothetical protein
MRACGPDGDGRKAAPAAAVKNHQAFPDCSAAGQTDMERQQAARAQAPNSDSAQARNSDSAQAPSSDSGQAPIVARARAPIAAPAQVRVADRARPARVAAPAAGWRLQPQVWRGQKPAPAALPSAPSHPAPVQPPAPARYSEKPCSLQYPAQTPSRLSFQFRT